MNNTIQLYDFVHGGAAIYRTRLETIDKRPEPPGQETVSIQLRVEEVLWGEPATQIGRFEFTQPASEIARLKFPPPIWGQVNLQKGAHIFLVTNELSETPADPLYVEEITTADEPVLTTIRMLLTAERSEANPVVRKERYLRYLTSTESVLQLYGAEALAKDEDLPAIDPTGQVAQAMATIYSTEQDAFVRLSLGGWLWNDIYPRTNQAGRAAIINATMTGLTPPPADVQRAVEPQARAESESSQGEFSEDVQRFNLDQLVSVDLADLIQADVMVDPEVVRLLQERVAQESAPEVREHLRKLIEVLKQ